MSKKEEQERKPFSNLYLGDTGTPNRKAVGFVGNSGRRWGGGPFPLDQLLSDHQKAVGVSRDVESSGALKGISRSGQ